MPVTPGIWSSQSAEYRPDRYYLYEHLVELLHGWAKAHSDVLRIEKIGTSFEGRDLFALTITNFATGNPEDKPAYYADANVHAAEVTGVSTVLWMINHILTNREDDAIARMLDTTTLYLIPAINVDAMDAMILGGHSMVRSSKRPYPEAEQKDGLVQQDIDGNGLILTMRIRDEAGPWTPSSHDPRIMRKRGPDEYGGDYYFVLPEGEIQNWDGTSVPLAPLLHGLDANRNFPHEWAPNFVQQGAGAYPLSEPETRAVIDFLIAHPNIHGTQHFHTFSGAILRAPTFGPTSDLPALDQVVFKTIGAMGTEETGYPCISIFDDFAYDKKKPVNGSLIDWVYQQFGGIPYATELWSLTAKAGVEVPDFIEFFRNRSDEVDAKMLAVIDSEVNGEGFQEWTPFEHPQLGAVEIGGWGRTFTWTNPPGPMLEEVTSTNAKFVLRAAQTAPLLQIRDVSVEAVGDGVWKVSLDVHNVGFLPTYVTAAARKNGVTKQVRARIQAGEGAVLVAGDEELELGHLDGRVNVHGGLSFSDVYGISNRGRAEWVVQQKAGTEVAIEAWSDKAGKVRTTVTLG